MKTFSRTSERNGLSGKPVIGILAGSRMQEIEKSLPLMLSVMEYYPGYQFVIAGAPSIEPACTLNIQITRCPFSSTRLMPFCSSQSQQWSSVVRQHLKLPFWLVPVVVCYRGSYLSYQIARRLIRVRYISLVNLIMGREVVKELIQDEFNRENLRNELGPAG
jgi:lipid-A-disaccharide synthase